MTQRPPEATVIHLIKGSLDAEVRALIRPVPAVTVVAVPRRVFWPTAFILFVWYACVGRLQAVLVDNARSLHRLGRWTRWVPVPVTLIE